MTDTDELALLDAALAAEEEAARRLRAADVALAEAEEKAEDQSDNARLKATVERCATASAAAEAAVAEARRRRQAIEAAMHRDDVLAVLRRRYRLVRG